MRYIDSRDPFGNESRNQIASKMMLADVEAVYTVLQSRSLSNHTLWELRTFAAVEYCFVRRARPVRYLLPD